MQCQFFCVLQTISFSAPISFGDNCDVTIVLGNGQCKILFAERTFVNLAKVNAMIESSKFLNQTALQARLQSRPSNNCDKEHRDY